MDRKAQGTIEYLVIIAIVVVIALVVVGLLLQIMGNFGGMSESAARAAWKAGTPFAISDYAVSGATMTLVLQNTAGQTITFNNMDINSDTTGDFNNSSKSIPAGGTYTITGTLATACASGSKYAYNKTSIDINYNTPSVNNLTQTGAADITGTCA